MRYAPSPSVITDRVFSMSTSLDASTVTPGQHGAGGVLHQTGDGALGMRRCRQPEHARKRTDSSQHEFPNHSIASLEGGPTAAARLGDYLPSKGLKEKR